MDELACAREVRSRDAARPQERRRRSRDVSGAAAVEFALIVPVLVMMLFGIVTAGLSYSRALGLTNAVREGARFGASSDASPTLAAQWADDVIQQIRQSQFDDPSAQSQVCVQLWKVGTGAVANTGKCSSTAGASYISLPTTATDNPAVPNAATGTCVVRVLAARPFTIFIGVTSWDKVSVSSSVERYQRKDKIPTCA